MRLTDEQIDAVLTAANPAYPAVNPEHAPSWRRKARIIYAAAMRDAAGVAREHPHLHIQWPDQDFGKGAIAAGDGIATALETIAKETEQ